MRPTDNYLFHQLDLNDQEMKIENVSFVREQNEFASFSNGLLSEIFDGFQFQDVTLASDDGNLVGGHKVVLSVASSVFRTILEQQRKVAHPVIVCRGVKHEDLQCLLQFIYLGRTSLHKEKVGRFLRVAEDFGVSGLVRQHNSSSSPAEVIVESPEHEMKPRPEEFHESVFDAAYKESTQHKAVLSPDVSPIYPMEPEITCEEVEQKINSEEVEQKINCEEAEQIINSEEVEQKINSEIGQKIDREVEQKVHCEIEQKINSEVENIVVDLNNESLNIVDEDEPDIDMTTMVTMKMEVLETLDLSSQFNKDDTLENSIVKEECTDAALVSLSQRIIERNNEKAVALTSSKNVLNEHDSANISKTEKPSTPSKGATQKREKHKNRNKGKGTSKIEDKKNKSAENSINSPLVKDKSSSIKPEKIKRKIVKRAESSDDEDAVSVTVVSKPQKNKHIKKEKHDSSPRNKGKKIKSSKTELSESTNQNLPIEMSSTSAKNSTIETLGLDQAQINKDVENETCKSSPKVVKKEKNTVSPRTKNTAKNPKIEATETLNEVTIKEETFYAHLNETIVDPNLSKLGKFDVETDGQYKCDSCEYSSDQRKHVFVHKLSKHVKLKFECDVCENTFTDPRSLKKHKGSAHEDVRYECDMCDRTTSTAYHLASHKRRKHSA